MARRILQLQRAIRTSPRSPDFEGLDFYLQHMSDWTGLPQTPGFDKCIAEQQKNHSTFMKNARQAREEEAAAAKAKTPGGPKTLKGEGKGDGK